MQTARLFHAYDISRIQAWLQGECDVAKRIFSTISLIVAGAVIGFVAGAVVGFFIGRGADAIANQKHLMMWRSFYGGMTAAVAGLIAGAGTGGLGIRTRFGLEWLLITGIGILLGYWIRGGNRVLNDMGQLAGIAAIASWLVVLFLRLIFGKRLPRGGLERRVIVIYILIFGLVVFAGPPVLQAVSSIFYF